MNDLPSREDGAYLVWVIPGEQPDYAPATQEDIMRLLDEATFDREYPASLRWCVTHQYPALIYEDGGVACWWESVVEERTDDHELVSVLAAALGVEQDGPRRKPNTRRAPGINSDRPTPPRERWG